jgi:hypothetical protein
MASTRPATNGNLTSTEIFSVEIAQGLSHSFAVLRQSSNVNIAAVLSGVKSNGVSTNGTLTCTGPLASAGSRFNINFFRVSDEAHGGFGGWLNTPGPVDTLENHQLNPGQNPKCTI